MNSVRNIQGICQERERLRPVTHLHLQFRPYFSVFHFTRMDANTNYLGKWGGGGGQISTIFWSFGQSPDVMVEWSKTFDHRMTMTKIIKNNRGQMNKTGKFLPFTMDNFQGVMVMISALPLPQ